MNMPIRKPFIPRILLIGAAVLLSVFRPISCVRGEETKMSELPVVLQHSYKNADQNNPLYTQRFGADPGVMEYDGRLYVYMTDDIIEYDSAGKVKENSYSKIRTINCISSDDLVNWTDHGQIRVAGPDGIAWWAVNSWAPCAAHKTIDGQEKFFLYFCNGGNGIGVLVADSPTGPWRDERGSLLITRSVKNCADVTWLFDPAVMVDEDGTGYLAFGGGVPQGKQASPGTGRIVRLAEDMIHLDGDPVRLMFHGCLRIPASTGSAANTSTPIVPTGRPEVIPSTSQTAPSSTWSRMIRWDPIPMRESSSPTKAASSACTETITIPSRA